MAKNATQTLLTGGMKDLPKKSHGNGHNPHHKKNKPLKSNITNKVKARRAENADVVDVDSEDGGDGGGVAEDAPTPEEDPDALALSGARQPGEEGAVERLAGLHADDVMIYDDDDDMADTPQADVDDENYADVEDLDVEDDAEEDADFSENEDLRNPEEDELLQEFEEREQRLMECDLDSLDLHHDKEYARSLGLVAEHNEGLDLFNGDPFGGATLYGPEYDDMWKAAETAIMEEDEREHTKSNSCPPGQKRVRFEERVSSSPSDSEDEDDDDAYPDLLDNVLSGRNPLGAMRDLPIAMSFNDNESFYDFEDEQHVYQFDAESDMSDNSSDSYDCM
jgi:hypothetical protein